LQKAGTNWSTIASCTRMILIAVHRCPLKLESEKENVMKERLQSEQKQTYQKWNEMKRNQKK
jgi:hypothetical protein